MDIFSPDVRTGYEIRFFLCYLENERKLFFVGREIPIERESVISVWFNFPPTWIG